MISEKANFAKSNQTRDTGSQSQIRTFSAISKPNVSNSGTTESVPPTDVTEIFTPKSTTLIEVINIPLQVPTNSIRGYPTCQNDPKIPEKTAFEDNPFKTTDQKFSPSRYCVVTKFAIQ